MPRINLGEIQFRPYSSGDDITFGPDDYNPTAGAIHLNNIKFRPWEDPIISSIGGSGIGEGGGGGGDTPYGTYAVFIDQTNNTERQVQYFVPGVQRSLYVSAEIYIPSSIYATMVAPSTATFYQPIEICEDTPTSADGWQGVYFTNRNASNVNDGNLYLWDYFSAASNKKLITADTWHTIELAIRNTSGNIIDFSFGLDGSNIAFGNPLTLVYTGWQYIRVGFLYPPTTSTQRYYIDNVKYATTGFISAGATATLVDNFETGDFSNAYGTVNPPSLGTPP